MKTAILALSMTVLLFFACCVDEKSERWSAEKLENYNIGYLMNVGGKLAYMAQSDSVDGTKFFFVYDGKEIGKEYDDTGLDLYVLNGKPAYFAWKDNKSFIVYDGKEYGKEYDYVDHIFTSVGGELTYFAIKDNKSFIVQGETEIGKEYDQTGYSVDINASDLSGYDAEKINIRYDTDGNASYQLIVPAFGEVNGKLAYIAEKDRKTFIVYDGQEIGKEYDKVFSHITVGNHTYLRPVNGKLTYLAMTGNKTFIVYDGQEMGKGDYMIDPFSITGVDGKLVFSAKRGNTSFIVYDGKEMDKYYDEIFYAFDYNGKLVYPAQVAGKPYQYIAVYDGQVMGQEYDSVLGVSVLNGKLIYTVSKDLKTFFVYDGVEIGREYDNVESATEINGKLIYTAWKDNNQYLVKEN